MPEFPSAGDEFADYQLQSVIGRGPMSVVYEAEHPRLGNGVALKVLAAELADDDIFRTRFLAESRIAASMNHPHVIPIYDAGPSDGLLYIAMRRVSGSNLRQMIAKRGPVQTQTAVFLLSQAAQALDAAHRMGLVHRDVKPENLLIERDDDAGFAHLYLADFGISRLGMERNGLTSTGQFLGTVDYVAPEQLSEPSVYGPADQYSLGCVLYECLTGRVPFGRDRDVQEPGTRATLSWTALSPAVDEMFARVLAERPGDRYNTCREFAQAASVALGDRATVPLPGGRSRALPPALAPAGHRPAPVAAPAPAPAPAPAGNQPGPEPVGHRSAPVAAGYQPTAALARYQPTAELARYQPTAELARYQPAATFAGPATGAGAAATGAAATGAAATGGRYQGEVTPKPAAYQRDPAREGAELAGAPGSRGGRFRARWLVIAAVLLLACAGGGAGAYAALSSPPKATGSASSAMTSKSPMPQRARASLLTRVLSAADTSRVAMGRLPPSSCKQRGKTSVVCTAPWPTISSATFTTYPTRAALFAAYEARVRSLNSGRYRQNVQDCGLSAPSPYGEIAWNHREQHSRAYTVDQMIAGKVSVTTAMGRMACMMTARHSEDIVWTTDYGKMLGVAIGRGSHTGVWYWWIAVHHNIVFPGTPMNMTGMAAPLMSGAPMPTSSPSSSPSMPMSGG